MRLPRSGVPTGAPTGAVGPARIAVSARMVAPARAASSALPLALALLLAGPSGAAAQDPERNGHDVQVHVPESLDPAAVTPMKVPFAVGENLTYEVRFGRKVVGEGFLRVNGVQDIRHRPAYQVGMGLDGSMWPWSIKYRFDSWMDIENLASYRFVQDQTGVDARYRAYDIFPAERRWERTDAEDSGETLSDVPLDQVSFLYYVRTLPLEVGDEYVLDQYFKEDGNPVRIRVLRKDRKTVPAGTFDTVVIEPVIRTSGLFGDGGQAEIHLTDDDRRIMVYMLSRVKWLPDIHLRLKDIS
ncbi:MAG: DUF3108 domain-containing protein [Longimicrobiales bacterium]|nr:DUF3108 domain-containing protein [Longimicrobiales bacterium]